jgi:hypothetical protein
MAPLKAPSSPAVDPFLRPVKPEDVMREQAFRVKQAELDVIVKELQEVSMVPDVSLAHVKDGDAPLLSPR